MNMLRTDNLVSAIIVTYNSQDYISDCLKALLKTHCQQIEIIVVDNNSSDETVNLISTNFPDIKIIKSKKNLGYAGGNNLGAEKARGKYIAIINPDTIVSPKWLEPLVKGLNDSAICQPKILLTKNKKLINCTGKTTHYLGFECLKDYKKRDRLFTSHYIDSFSGSVFLTTKSFFIESGGFDNLFFMYYEDGDLSWRFRLMGKKIKFIPEAITYHDYKYIPKENYQKTRQKFYYLERNRLIMILKNYSIKTLILISPTFIFMELGMVFYFILKGWSLDKIKGYIWIFKNRRSILQKREDIQKKRILSDHEVTRNFVGKISYEELNNPVLNFFVNPLLNGYWKIIKKFI